MDFVFRKRELGRHGTYPEWKVEWSFEHSPRPALFVRKLSLVAYAEICGPEEAINSYWPQIMNAAVLSGIAAGIATIVFTPGAAAPVFRAEFARQMCLKVRKEFTMVPTTSATSSNLTFEAIDEQFRELEAEDACEPGGELYFTAADVAASPADVLAKICPVYKRIRPILVALSKFALIPSGWKTAIKAFIRAMDLLCP